MRLDKADYYQEWFRTNELKYDKQLISIIDFYVMKSFANQSSSRGIKMNELGWQRDKKIYQKLYKYLLFKSKLIKDKDVITITKSLNKACLKRIGLADDFYNNLNKNRICYLKNSRDVDDIFFYIRCAIAHGRFAIISNKYGKWYVMENIKEYNNQYILKARMIIDEKVLITWMNIILDGYNTMCVDIDDLNNKIIDKVLRYITKYQVKTEQMIINYIDEQENCFDKKEILNKLKTDYIRYDRSKKIWILR